METKTAFFKFLVEHHALFPFIINLNLEEMSHLFQNIPEFWIELAFKWSETPEGYTYWAILDNCWLKKCSTL